MTNKSYKLSTTLNYDSRKNSSWYDSRIVIYDRRTLQKDWRWNKGLSTLLFTGLKLTKLIKQFACPYLLNSIGVSGKCTELPIRFVLQEYPATIICQSRNLYFWTLVGSFSKINLPFPIFKFEWNLFFWFHPFQKIWKNVPFIRSIVGTFSRSKVEILFRGSV